MKYKNKRAVLYALLLSLVTAKVSGCGYSDDKETNLVIESIDDLGKENNLEVQKLEIEDIPVEKETEEVVEVQPVEEESQFKEIASVIANSNVNIRKAPSTEGELAGKLVEGHTLEMVEKLSNGWYKVLYYGEERYVSGDFVSEITTYQVNGEIKKVCYATQEMEMTIPSEVSKSGNEEKVTISSLECLEIYEENEDNYLAQTNDYIGYVAKTSLKELTGGFVVVDISDQKLKLYENNKVILETPVVTGTPTKSRRSDEGLFKIYEFKKQDYLRGPGYASYVDIMMKYNRGEGLHDAEYHTCNNGKENEHGWKAEWQFGGDTYLTNGSHGCINMPHDAAITVYNNVEIGTRVLVHK